MHISIWQMNSVYHMTIFASSAEREIQQFDWFPRSLELAVRKKYVICQLWNKMAKLQS